MTTRKHRQTNAHNISLLFLYFISYILTCSNPVDFHAENEGHSSHEHAAAVIFHKRILADFHFSTRCSQAVPHLNTDWDRLFLNWLIKREHSVSDGKHNYFAGQGRRVKIYYNVFNPKVSVPIWRGISSLSGIWGVPKGAIRKEIESFLSIAYVHVNSHFKFGLVPHSVRLGMQINICFYLFFFILGFE